MRGTGKGTLTALAVAVGMLAALPATASGATFVVNLTGNEGDPAGDGRCDVEPEVEGRQCTLQAAVDEANSDAGSRDTIKFDPVVNGNTIFPVNNFSLDTPMVINGGDCPVPMVPHAPCVRVDNPSSGAVAFSVNEDGDDVTIKGLSLTGVASFAAIAVRPGANRFKLRNSWLGMDLDQNAESNNTGIWLEGNDAEVGGTRGKDRNVFADNAFHLSTNGPDLDKVGNRSKIRGNYFGTQADGTTPAGNALTAIEVAGTDNVVGASISSSKRATPECDGGCNVIVDATFNGISDPGTRTRIKGNFVGLDKNGAAALVNGLNSIEASGTDAAIGGDTSAERNFIAQGSNAGVLGSGASDLSVKRNFVGLTSTGNAIPSGSVIGDGLILGEGGLAARNRIAGVFNGLRLNGDDARVVRNKVGIAKDGDDLPGASVGIFATREDGVIGEPGAGNTVGNSGTGIGIVPLGGSGDDGDGNVVQGNFVGVDSGGVPRDNSSNGISLAPSGAVAPDDNLIGGNSGASENVISNSGDDAIRIETGAAMPERNRIRRNRGKDNGGGLSLFIDIGPDGFGNAAGPNDQIEAPELDNCEPGDATRTHAQSEGGGARPNATIYLFRTSAEADLSPNRINAFVKQVTADGAGGWEASFPQIPSGQNLTALQVDPDGNASELALAVDPVAPPGSC